MLVELNLTPRPRLFRIIVRKAHDLCGQALGQAIGFAATGAYRGSWQAVRDNVGLPFFVLAVATIAMFVWQMRRMHPRPARLADTTGADAADWHRGQD